VREVSVKKFWGYSVIDNIFDFIFFKVSGADVLFPKKRVLLIELMS